MLNIAGYPLREDQNVTGKDWNNLIAELKALRNYQLLEFTVSQTDFSDPTFVDWFANDLQKQGDSLAMTRSGQGRYSLTSTKGSFKPGKTFIEFSGLDYAASPLGSHVNGKVITPNEILLESSDNFNAPADNVFEGVHIRIFILD